MCFALLYCLPQWLALCQQVSLSKEVVNFRWPHAIGQRAVH
jgi:hypothetical protein